MERVKKAQVAKLKRYLKKESILKVAHLCGYEETNAIKMWIKRESIPSYIWPRLKPLLEGKISVEIQIN